MRCIPHLSEQFGKHGKSLTLVKRGPPGGSQRPWAEVVEGTEHKSCLLHNLTSSCGPALVHPLLSLHLVIRWLQRTRCTMVVLSEVNTQGQSQVSGQGQVSEKASWDTGQREKGKTLPMIIDTAKCTYSLIYWRTTMYEALNLKVFQNYKNNVYLPATYTLNLGEKRDVIKIEKYGKRWHRPSIANVPALYPASNCLRYATSWGKESRIWKTGITIHLSGESQRFPKARQMLGKRNYKWGELLGKDWPWLGLPPSCTNLLIMWIQLGWGKDGWNISLDNALIERSLPAAFHIPEGGIPCWLPVHSDGYVESQASEQMPACQSHRPHFGV